MSLSFMQKKGAFVACAILMLLVMAFNFERAGAEEGANSDAKSQRLLTTIHLDLQRIEEKMDALADPQWEYKILTPNVIDEDAVDRYSPNLNPLGKQGWELVNYSPDIGYIMKRRVKRPRAN